MTLNRLILSLLTLLCSSCAMNYGGGTIGTGLSSSYGSSVKLDPGAKVSYLTISGSIKDVKDAPLADAKITVETAGDRSETLSDSRGSFQVPLVFSPGHEIRFRFESKSFNAQYILRKIPQNIRGAQAAFRIVSGNKVELQLINFDDY